MGSVKLWGSQITICRIIQKMIIRNIPKCIIFAIEKIIVK